jgi:hypothetical protein
MMSHPIVVTPLRPLSRSHDPTVLLPNKPRPRHFHAEACLGSFPSPRIPAYAAMTAERQIELLELDASGIHVAEYLTVLPPPEVLHRKLHEAIETARARIEANERDVGQEGAA